MDDALMVALEPEEKKIGFTGMLRMLVLHPRKYFKETVARDKFPALAFTAWLVGLAHSLMWLDSSLLTKGGLISNQFSSFALIILMSFVFMGFFYMVGGVLFHFNAYLADSRKDMKNSLAVAIYAWLPFVVAVFLVKFISIILLGTHYLNPPQGWWFTIPSYAIVGIAILYGWFLGIFGAVTGLGCRIIRSIVFLFIAPILWFVFYFMLFKFLGFM